MYVAEDWDVMQNAFVTIDYSKEWSKPLSVCKKKKTIHVAPHLLDILLSLIHSFIPLKEY